MKIRRNKGNANRKERASERGSEQTDGVPAPSGLNGIWEEEINKAVFLMINHFKMGPGPVSTIIFAHRLAS